jgi:hypothetical protein
VFEERTNGRLQLEQQESQHLEAADTLRSRIRQLQKELEIQTAEKERGRGLIDSLQTQIKQMMAYAKSIEAGLRGEKQKGTVALVEIDSTRREKFNEMDKMKIDLEAVKRLEVDLATEQFRMELDSKNEAIARLRDQLEDRSRSLRDAEAKLARLAEKYGFENLRSPEEKKRVAVLQAEKDMADNNRAILGPLR